eukprot:43768_1
MSNSMFDTQYFHQFILYQILLFIQITLVIAINIKYCRERRRSNTEHQINYHMKCLFFMTLFFKKSAFELSTCMITTLLIITFGTYFILIILLFTFQTGNVIHSDNKDTVLCEGMFTINSNPILRITLQCIIIIANIFYGWIFYKQLHDLLKFVDSQTNESCCNDFNNINKLRSVYRLMNKQTTLVMVSTVSTSIIWTISNILYYNDSYLQLILYFDISINILCLFLMFSFNEKLYMKLCKPFDKMTHLYCSQMFKSETLNKIGYTVALQEINAKNTRISHTNITMIHIKKQISHGNTALEIKDVSSSESVQCEEIINE